MDEIQDNPTVHKEKKQKKKLNPFVRNLLISSILLVIAVILLAAWFMFRPDNKTDKHDLFNIEMISELTTLECRYHNVAVRDKEGNFFGVGEKGLLMILCDMQFPPHLLYENTFDSDEIQFV